MIEKLEYSDLERVKQEFINFRANRVKKKSPIPEELWEAALRLAENYPKGLIKKELSLNSKQFNKRLSEQNPSNGEYQLKEKEPEFIELNHRLIAFKNQASQMCQITIKQPAGNKLSISLPVDSPSLIGLCTSLLGVK
jgi:hypothetical protein